MKCGGFRSKEGKVAMASTAPGLDTGGVLVGPGGSPGVTSKGGVAVFSDPEGVTVPAGSSTPGGGLPGMGLPAVVDPLQSAVPSVTTVPVVVSVWRGSHTAGTGGSHDDAPDGADTAVFTHEEEPEPPPLEPLEPPDWLVWPVT